MESGDMMNWIIRMVMLSCDGKKGRKVRLGVDIVFVVKVLV